MLTSNILHSLINLVWTDRLVQQFCNTKSDWKTGGMVLTNKNMDLVMDWSLIKIFWQRSSSKLTVVSIKSILKKKLTLVYFQSFFLLGIESHCWTSSQLSLIVWSYHLIVNIYRTEYLVQPSVCFSPLLPGNPAHWAHSGEESERRGGAKAGGHR